MIYLAVFNYLADVRLFQFHTYWNFGSSNDLSHTSFMRRLLSPGRASAVCAFDLLPVSRVDKSTGNIFATAFPLFTDQVRLFCAVFPLILKTRYFTLHRCTPPSSSGGRVASLALSPSGSPPFLLSSSSGGRRFEHSRDLLGKWPNYEEGLLGCVRKYREHPPSIYLS